MGVWDCKMQNLPTAHKNISKPKFHNELMNEGSNILFIENSLKTKIKQVSICVNFLKITLLLLSNVNDCIFLEPKGLILSSRKPQRPRTEKLKKRKNEQNGPLAVPWTKTGTKWEKPHKGSPRHNHSFLIAKYDKARRYQFSSPLTPLPNTPPRLMASSSFSTFDLDE